MKARAQEDEEYLRQHNKMVKQVLNQAAKINRKDNVDDDDDDSGSEEDEDENESNSKSQQELNQVQQLEWEVERVSTGCQERVVRGMGTNL